MLNFIYPQLKTVMRALNYFCTDEMAEYDNIVAGKANNTRVLLAPVRDDVERSYDYYKGKFADVNMAKPGVFDENVTKALLDCYKKTNARDLMIAKIIECQQEHLQLICGYCLLNNRETIDHYIPQSEFPVYSVMPRNLIPACSKCNSKKKEIWRENSRRVVLHLLNDHIPSDQFLFGKLIFNGAVPVITFKLNRGIINHERFLLIQDHFRRLELVKRYQRDGIPRLISDIRSTIDAQRVKRQVQVDEKRELLSGLAIQYRAKLGNNYWKAIALELLSNSATFLATI